MTLRPTRRVLIVLLVVAACGPAARAEQPPAFPAYGILPKQETGALRFLKEHEKYDGRGVVVAIFDTGVDPGAAGLQTTSDGKPKIIDMVDGSGSGDVDTSTVRETKDKKQEGEKKKDAGKNKKGNGNKAAQKGNAANGDQANDKDPATILGLTGRKLAIPADWNNPTGKYHVGIKRAFELYPGGLVGRLKRKRREGWDARQRALTTRNKRELVAFDKAHPKPKGDDKLAREELANRLKMLEAAQKDHDDPGPVFDCVVFHDGRRWQAAIDTDEDGDLADEKLMTNYRHQRQYATFGDEDLLDFAVNIYDDGNLLSIVTDTGAHGTHVAGIVAAHYPDRPELNGLAPGAQIVSVKIGDARLGSSSTGTGEVRGLVAVLNNKCDLINMSYGGPTAVPDAGRVIDLYSEIVNKHNVIFVASAGNSGPALTTVGAPGGTTSAIIGVGAYVSPEMMEVAYSLRKKLPEIPYTWSSRGPAADGDLGVDICAPGGAIAPVPNWQLQANMLMNGTSMSSPNACGGIALVLSALKAEKIPYTPHSVRRALQNTARKLESGTPFAHGQGLIQIDKAFDYLSAQQDKVGEPLRFAVRVSGGSGVRGVYLREAAQRDKVLETNVNVRPVFHEDADNREKVRLEMRVALQSTQPWVETPQHLLLVHGGRRFKVRVDPTKLPPGAHFAEVLGYDAADRARGPLFRVPVTVIRTGELSTENPDARPAWAETLHFQPGQIVRRFFAVPAGATWAELNIRSGDLDESRTVVMHALELLPKLPFSESEKREFITLRPRSETTQTFKVTGGRTLELALAQFWSSLGESELEFELTFHGIVPSDPDVELGRRGITARIDVSAPLGTENLSPSATLNTLRRALRPTKSQIRPLSGERDKLPDERQTYEMILTYEFELDADAEVTPRVSLTMQDESWRSWESHVWMIFDSNKRLVATGAGDDKKKLDKGKYVLRFHLRHETPASLEQYKAVVLRLDRALDKPISLGVHADAIDALAGGGKFSAGPLAGGEATVLFVAPPSDKQRPSAAAAGDQLLGTLTLGKSVSGRQRPGGYPLSFVVPPAAKSDSSSATSSADKDEKEKTLDEQLRETRLARLKKLREKKDRKAFDKLAAEILNKWPNHLPVLVEQMKFGDDKDRRPHLPQIVKAAERVIARIDTAKLAAHYGVNLDKDDEAAAKVRKKMDEQKATLADALYRKARALAYMDLPEKYQPEDQKKLAVKKFPADEQERDKLFEQTFAELKKWVDVTDDQYVLVTIRRERRHHRPATALKLLGDHLDANPRKKVLYKKRGDLYDELGWDHWRDYQRTWLLLRFPEKYPVF